jgi:hypothetical protein
MVASNAINGRQACLSPFGLMISGSIASAYGQAASTQRPNIVMLMTDDTGWNDFGAYSGGGLSLGHPTPNVDRINGRYEEPARRLSIEYSGFLASGYAII